MQTNERRPACSPCAPCCARRGPSTPTATSRVGSTTPSRRGSRRNPACGSSRSTRPATIRSSSARCINVKEERAELVKHHLDVLWHDYFKPEHLEKHPGIHETFWKATKQASKVKQSIDVERGEGAAADDRLDRRDVEDDRRTEEDARERPALLTLEFDSVREPMRRLTLCLLAGRQRGSRPSPRDDGSTPSRSRVTRWPRPCSPASCCSSSG